MQAEETSPIPTEPASDIEQSALDEPVQNNITDQTTTDKEAVIEESKTEEAAKTADGANNEVNNGIPVIYLHINESKGTIDAMNEDLNHNTYCYGAMDFILPSNDFQYADLQTDLTEYHNLGMSIKGRGNLTWLAEKKPYKIKLEQKTDLLGLGIEDANEHWVLLANAYDPTLIRNRLTAYIGDNIGLEYTPIGVPVDLVINNQYLGSYLLMEHVRLGKGRVDTDELYESDVDPPDITSGYIVQEGSQTDAGAASYFTTKSGLQWNNHTPSFDPQEGDYINDVQKNYIRSYMQMVEDILYSDTQVDAGGNSYTKYMDVTSAAKYWLVQELSYNLDAYRTGSTYLYKTRDTDWDAGKLYWGPLWDFDMAWGDFNPDMPELADRFYAISGWILPMLYDTSPTSFYQEIQNQWPALKSLMLEIIKENGMIDQYYNGVRQSQAQDAIIYPYFDEYLTMIENTKRWIEYRVNWMDEHLQDLQYESRKIKILEAGQPDIIHYVRNNSPLNMLKEPEKEGYVFIGWMTPDGTTVTKDTIVTSDLILIPQFITIDEAIIRGLIPMPYRFQRVVTGVHTNSSIWWMSMTLSLLGMIFLTFRKHPEIE